MKRRIALPLGLWLPLACAPQPAESLLRLEGDSGTFEAGRLHSALGTQTPVTIAP